MGDKNAVEWVFRGKEKREKIYARVDYQRLSVEVKALASTDCICSRCDIRVYDPGLKQKTKAVLTLKA